MAIFVIPQSDDGNGVCSDMLIRRSSGDVYVVLYGLICRLIGGGIYEVIIHDPLDIPYSCLGAT